MGLLIQEGAGTSGTDRVHGKIDQPRLPSESGSRQMSLESSPPHFDDGPRLGLEEGGGAAVGHHLVDEIGG